MTRWSAALLALSLVGLVAILVYGASTGFVREPDEGAAAHLWQLSMAAQLPLGVFFAVTWFPRAPRAAWAGVVTQVTVVLASLGVVRYFNL